MQKTSFFITRYLSLCLVGTVVGGILFSAGCSPDGSSHDRITQVLQALEDGKFKGNFHLSTDGGFGFRLVEGVEFTTGKTLFMATGKIDFSKTPGDGDAHENTVTSTNPNSLPVPTRWMFNGSDNASGVSSSPRK